MIISLTTIAGLVHAAGSRTHGPLMIEGDPEHTENRLIAEWKAKNGEIADKRKDAFNRAMKYGYLDFFDSKYAEAAAFNISMHNKAMAMIGFNYEGLRNSNSPLMALVLCADFISKADKALSEIYGSFVGDFHNMILEKSTEYIRKAEEEDQGLSRRMEESRVKIGTAEFRNQVANDFSQLIIENHLCYNFTYRLLINYLMAMFYQLIDAAKNARDPETMALSEFMLGSLREATLNLIISKLEQATDMMVKRVLFTSKLKKGSRAPSIEDNMKNTKELAEYYRGIIMGDIHIDNRIFESATDFQTIVNQCTHFKLWWVIMGAYKTTEQKIAEISAKSTNPLDKLKHTYFGTK